MGTLKVWKMVAFAVVATLLIFASLPPPRRAHAAEHTWIDLPGQYPPSMIRFQDTETGAVCYLIPGRYEGLGVVYSPALSCVKVRP